MTSLGSFFFLLFFLSPTLVALTPEARMSLNFLESLMFLCCFFFLSFLALSEDSGSVEADAGVETGALSLDSSPGLIAPWVWTYFAVV